MSFERTESTSSVDSRGCRHTRLPTKSGRSIEASDAAKRRWSTLGLLVKTSTSIQAKLNEHCDIEFNPEECEITPNRLEHVRKMVVARRTSCVLAEEERRNLVKEQRCIKSLLVTGGVLEEDDEIIPEEEEDGEEDLAMQLQQQRNEDLRDSLPLRPPPPQDIKQDRSFSAKLLIDNIRAQLINLKLRSRLDLTNDGVLGVQSEGDMRCSLKTLPQTHRRCSIRNDKIGRGSVVDEHFVKYNMSMIGNNMKDISEEVVDEEKEMDVEYVDHVRKPDMATIVEQYDAMTNHPKYS